MIQKIYIPTHPALFKIVNFLSYVEITAEDKLDGSMAIFPNATSNLMISLDEKIRVDESLVDTSIYASCSSTVSLRPYAGMKFMTVQFNNFGLYYLKQVPAYELHDSLLHMDLFFSASDIDRISSQLKEKDHVQDKFIALESFIKERIGLEKVDPRLYHAINMLKSEQVVSIHQLSEALCISGRSLQKIFKKYVGLSPAHFRKIVRFNRATNLLLNSSADSLTNITYECGYYDQAHFIKDFRKFGGISPSEFLKLKVHSSDFYNYNLREIDSLALK
ncbi:helix-turn-helix domain-containing protein [Muriicola sp. Z0-33]|uniref:helix-turn-helix domain-containing protein n=1 Tax=Muriicola sp. Z0-33 TaxID=2816957 RepID=UPI002237FD57|nr:helix-turn-helix domain-containing protein [Muriicola sp. Z0-33]MCW5518086.1 AraC family transcriptional regulator [Muriicola sp. Z0-33]